MKVRINRWYNALLASLFALLGFESCNSSSDEPCEYGAPYAEYVVRGTVTDEAGQPIEGIKAQVGYAISYSSSNPSERVFEAVDSAFTDAKGEFQTGELSDMYSPDLAVVLEDVDGEANGGEFLTDTVMGNNLKKEQTLKGDGWYQGKFEYSFTRKLRRK